MLNHGLVVEFVKKVWVSGFGIGDLGCRFCITPKITNPNPETRNPNSESRVQKYLGEVMIRSDRISGWSCLSVNSRASVYLLYQYTIT